MAANLNLEHAARYLNSVQAGKLDGLREALEGKLSEVGLAAAAPVVPATVLGQEPSGNVRGILTFIASVGADSSKGDKRKLAALAGTVFARTGHVARPTPTVDEAPAPAPAAEATTEGPARRRRRRRRA